MATIDYKNDPDYIKRFQKYLNALKTNENDSKSQYELARCYYYGFGTRENKDKGLEWFKIAANNGNVEAMNMLGDINYNELQKTEKNIEDALKWYRLAAKHGHKDSMVELGHIYMNRKNNIPEALKFYIQADNTLGNYNLLHYFYNTENFAKAFEYGDKLLKKNENGTFWPEIEIMMGSIYYTGDGTAKDVDKARALFVLALNTKGYLSKDNKEFAEKMIKIIDDKKFLANPIFFTPSTKPHLLKNSNLSVLERYPDMSSMSNQPVGAFGNFGNEEDLMQGGSRKRKSKSRKHKASKSKSKLRKRKSKTHKRKH